MRITKKLRKNLEKKYFEDKVDIVINLKHVDYSVEKFFQVFGYFGLYFSGLDSTYSLNSYRPFWNYIFSADTNVMLEPKVLEINEIKKVKILNLKMII